MRIHICQVCDKHMPKSKTNWKHFGYMGKQYVVCSEDCMWTFVENHDEHRRSE